MPSTEGKDEEEEGGREEGGEEEAEEEGTTLGDDRHLGVLRKWSSDQPAPQPLACVPFLSPPPLRV